MTFQRVVFIWLANKDKEVFPVCAKEERPDW